MFEFEIRQIESNSIQFVRSTKHHEQVISYLVKIALSDTLDGLFIFNAQMLDPNGKHGESTFSTSTVFTVLINRVAFV